MYFRTILLAFSLITFSDQALAQQTQFQIIGIRGQVLLNTVMPPSQSTLGNLSHSIISKALQKKEIFEYQGSNIGVTSINRLHGVIEVISKTEIKAYGWCYSVDGQLPDIMAGEYQLKGHETSIIWFYVYAHMQDNEWKSMCNPADHFPTD